MPWPLLPWPLLLVFQSTRRRVPRKRTCAPTPAVARRAESGRKVGAAPAHPHARVRMSPQSPWAILAHPRARRAVGRSRGLFCLHPRARVAVATGRPGASAVGRNCECTDPRSYRSALVAILAHPRLAGAAPVRALRENIWPCGGGVLESALWEGMERRAQIGAGGRAAAQLHCRRDRRHCFSFPCRRCGAHLSGRCRVLHESGSVHPRTRVRLSPPPHSSPAQSGPDGAGIFSRWQARGLRRRATESDSSRPHLQALTRRDGGVEFRGAAGVGALDRGLNEA